MSRADLLPEVTIRDDGEYWPAVSAAGPHPLVKRVIFPLSSALPQSGQPWRAKMNTEQGGKNPQPCMKVQVCQLSQCKVVRTGVCAQAIEDRQLFTSLSESGTW